MEDIEIRYYGVIITSLSNKIGNFNACHPFIKFSEELFQELLPFFCSSSKRVTETLSNYPEFNTSCDSVFEDSISKTQFAFPGIKPYQLLSATQNLHHLLLPSLPIISKWAPTPPDRTQVDQAYKKVLNLRQEEGECLDREEFRVYALEVFSNVVVARAGSEMLKMVPIGVVGIGGVGVVVKANGGVLGAAIGTYVLAVATKTYLGLAV